MDFKCICGVTIRRSEGQHDFKCEHCGRVYTYRGQMLWRESTLNSLPGTGEIITDDNSFYNRRADNQDEALEEAFVEGKLPEEPRREEDVEPTDIPPDGATEPNRKGSRRKR